MLLNTFPRIEWHAAWLFKAVIIIWCKYRHLVGKCTVALNLGHFEHPRRARVLVMNLEPKRQNNKNNNKQTNDLICMNWIEHSSVSYSASMYRSYRLTLWHAVLKTSRKVNAFSRLFTASNRAEGAVHFISCRNSSQSFFLLTPCALLSIQETLNLIYGQVSNKSSLEV